MGDVQGPSRPEMNDVLSICIRAEGPLDLSRLCTECKCILDIFDNSLENQRASMRCYFKDISNACDAKLDASKTYDAASGLISRHDCRKPSKSINLIIIVDTQSLYALAGSLGPLSWVSTSTKYIRERARWQVGQTRSSSQECCTCDDDAVRAGEKQTLQQR